MSALVLLAFGAVVLGPALAQPPAAHAADRPGDIVVTVPSAGGGDDIVNAQLRWGLNRESGSGAYAGGCNFLSAGRAGNAGGARAWTASDGLYRAESGNVRIEKPTAAGAWKTATWADRCLDADGRAVTAASTTSATGNQVVIDGGKGSLVPGAGLRIAWKGSFTVVFYGGMTYWSITDPVLSLDERGDGALTGTASGYGTSMDDLTKWEPLPSRSIVLADIRKADVGSGKGFTVLPRYLGVAVRDAGQSARTAQNAAYWGSFPADFVAYQKLTGQAGYWLSTGGQRDPAKPASELYVSYDAKAPVVAPPPTAAGGGSGAPSNPIRQRPPGLAGAGGGEGPAGPIAGDPGSAGAAAVQPVVTGQSRPGLVPAASGTGIPPVVAPLLGTAAALLISVLAVLNLMGALPWQRRPA